MSEKEKAFGLFDQGYRPSQIDREVKVSRRVLYNYYQEWHKTQKGISLEIEEEDKDIELQLEAEEAEERAKILQQEVDEEARRQQQEIKSLADKLHSIEVMLRHYQWFPDNLLIWWVTHSEVNSIYPTPEAYLKALGKRRDYLQAKIRDIQTGAMPVEQEKV